MNFVEVWVWVTIFEEPACFRTLVCFLLLCCPALFVTLSLLPFCSKYGQTTVTFLYARRGSDLLVVSAHHTLPWSASFVRHLPGIVFRFTPAICLFVFFSPTALLFAFFVFCMAHPYVMNLHPLTAAPTPAPVRRIDKASCVGQWLTAHVASLVST